ncbi:MAG: oxygen-dependent coproporphyrinogen oxidase [Bacteroidota bacterium]
MIQPISTSTVSLRERVETFFENLQNEICLRIEEIDRKGRFHEDRWTHVEHGGGRTRVLEQGAVFEKAGVNTSSVGGILPESLARHLSTDTQGYAAAGISLIFHPDSPMIPTVHMNFRYIELERGDAWFGGGADLTPYYPYREDVKHFHRVLKGACDRHDPTYYPKFKQWCDEYFFLKHRNEARGVGGIFFDYLRGDAEKLFAFVQDAGRALLPAYVPIVERRRGEPWGKREKEFQLIRRGRYVEFNLVYDRGTLFGLETKGRIESILISLPPGVTWRYGYQPEPGSREAELQEFLKPRDWA